MSTNNNQVDNRLWGAADELRANSKLDCGFLAFSEARVAARAMARPSGRRIVTTSMSR